MSNPACSQGNCSCHLTRDSCCQQQLSISTPLFASLGCFCSHSAKFHPPSPWVPSVQLAGILLQATSNTQPAWDISSVLKQHQFCVELAGLLSQMAGACLNGGGPRGQASTRASGSQIWMWGQSVAKLPQLLPAPLSGFLILSQFSY